MISKCKALVLISFIIIGTVLPTLAENLQDKTIHITDDDGEWPPYVYYKWINGKKSTEIVGFSVDVVKEILSKNDINFTITLLPWKRALLCVEYGEKYQIILAGTYNKERAEKYYISNPYFTTSAYYFYSKKHNPNGLNIKKKADYKKYKVAGLRGYNYTNYGLNKDDIDNYLGNYGSMIEYLHLNRCDVFIESIEVFIGFSIIGKNYLADPDLGYGTTGDISSEAFHMMFTKKEVGKELKRIIDEGILEMEKSGRLDELKKSMSYHKQIAINNSFSNSCCYSAVPLADF